MYNIRKKLWILMMLLFVVSLVLLPFSHGEEERTVIASSGEFVRQQAAEASARELFGENTEKFVAHRGYSGYSPENSIPAFELAGRTGFWGIETDISETSDGYFVCMHDDTLDRTTDGSGAIADYTLEQLADFRIDYGNYLKTTENLKIPTLEEYLEICRDYGCVAVVEIKTIHNYDAFLYAVENSGMAGRCIITAGNVDDIRRVREINSSVPVMTIGYAPTPYTDNLSAAEGIDGERGILYNYPQVDGSAVEALHSRNIYCGVWSVDEEDIARTYLGYGVDFIVTNEIPARLEFMINENE